MPEVGIRELKERASQILREVREKRQTYTITHHGKPCGVLVPYSGAGTGKTTKKRKGRLVSLRGILKDGPEVSWEEFMELKKIWTKHVDELLAEELLDTRHDEEAESGNK